MGDLEVAVGAGSPGSEVDALVGRADAVAEIPRSIRAGAEVDRVRNSGRAAPPTA